MNRKEGKMDFNQIMDINNVEFGQMPPQAFLLGLLSAFDNRYQASADSFFKEITWKQFFAIICINLCKESPTINELSDIMGSSHQNVKQILNKLESKNFVQMIPDPKDKRKQRIILTDWCRTFCEKNDVQSQKMMAQLFEGIGEEQLLITIQTIMQMERNLKKL
ncbi:MAG: MarR family winged helix-turn-helix transcriptional regulator [Lachnospiraceae bacterium]